MVDGVEQGYFYEPTVITDVTPDMEIVQEEVFGPVVVAYPFKVRHQSSVLIRPHTILTALLLDAGRSRSNPACK